MNSSSYLPIILIVAAVALAGIVMATVRQPSALPSAQNAKSNGSDTPAFVTSLPGTEERVVVLTARAAARLGITTAPVVMDGNQDAVVPYAAVLYDTNGETWVYTNTESFKYTRHPITVSRISGDRATLTRGPAVGTAVVTSGAAELFGVEFGVGK